MSTWDRSFLSSVPCETTAGRKSQKSTRDQGHDPKGDGFWNTRIKSHWVVSCISLTESCRMCFSPHPIMNLPSAHYESALSPLRICPQPTTNLPSAHYESALSPLWIWHSSKTFGHHVKPYTCTSRSTRWPRAALCSSLNTKQASFSFNSLCCELGCVSHWSFGVHNTAVISFACGGFTHSFIHYSW